jgi:hypothetical protein
MDNQPPEIVAHHGKPLKPGRLLAGMSDDQASALLDAVLAHSLTHAPMAPADLAFRDRVGAVTLLLTSELGLVALVLDVTDLTPDQIELVQGVGIDVQEVPGA